MSLKEILSKVFKGEELKDDEKEALGKLDPDDLEARLSAAEKERKRLASELDAEKRARAAAEKVVEDQKTAGMSELEKAQADLAAARAEAAAAAKSKADAETALGAMKRKSRVSELAAKFSFEDARYLDYLLEQDNVDIEQDAGVEKFISTVKAANPKLFKFATPPGPTPPSPENKPEPSAAGRVGEIMNAIAGAPAETVN